MNVGTRDFFFFFTYVIRVCACFLVALSGERCSNCYCVSLVQF